MEVLFLKPEQLKEFDCAVVTMHEFIHLTNDRQRQNVLEYLSCKSCYLYHSLRAGSCGKTLAGYLREKLCHSCVPVSARKMQDPEKMARPNNIINFGSIRAGKGHNQLVQLAHLIKDDLNFRIKSKNPVKNDIQIIIAGTAINPHVFKSGSGNLRAAG